MSVLFKALQRAEQARGGDASGHPPHFAAGEPGMPGLGRRRPPARRGRMLVRALGISFVALLGASAVVLTVFSDSVEDLIAALVMGEPAVQPRPAPPPAPQAAAVPEPAPQAAVPQPEQAAPEPDAAAVEAAPAPAATTTTDIAELMALGRAARGETQDEQAPAVQPAPASASAPQPGPAGGAIGAVPQSLTPETAAEDAAPAEPPAPRSLDDALAEQRRAETARALAPTAVVDRPEARRAGTHDVVSVAVPTPEARDTVDDAYRALLRGDYHSALASYGRVLEEDPRSLPALLGRAAALHKLRRLDDARVAYERVLALDPRNREALTNLLAIIGQAAPQEALQRLQALERTAPDFTPVLAQIALVYGQLGMDAEAIRYLRRAVAQDSGNLPYVYNLAILLDRAGEREAAARAYRAVLDGLRAGGGGAELAVSADRIRARLDYLLAAH